MRRRDWVVFLKMRASTSPKLCAETTISRTGSSGLRQLRGGDTEQQRRSLGVSAFLTDTHRNVNCYTCAPTLSSTTLCCGMHLPPVGLPTKRAVSRSWAAQPGVAASPGGRAPSARSGQVGQAIWPRCASGGRNTGKPVVISHTVWMTTSWAADGADPVAGPSSRRDPQGAVVRPHPAEISAGMRSHADATHVLAQMSWFDLLDTGGMALAVASARKLSPAAAGATRSGRPLIASSPRCVCARATICYTTIATSTRSRPCSACA